MTPEESVRLAHRWAYALVDQLVASGVRHFFIAPGSRSTPLTMAAARHPDAKTVIHFDERGTAFMALGAARATSMPAAWITTSGTAVANGFPAVIEASVDAAPMILLTADRPPELRQTGANQTIDQVKIFGDSVRWFADLPVPDPNVGLDFVRSTAAHAVARSTFPDAGPVHLNCMFREPLVSSASITDEKVDAVRFFHIPNKICAPDEQAVIEVAQIAEEARRGVIVAGRMALRDQSHHVAALAEALGWPLIADIGSQLRLGEGAASNRLSSLDPLLASGRALPHPDVLIHFGSGLVSKRISRWLAYAPSAQRISVRAESSRLDPSHQFDIRIQAAPGAFAESLRRHAHNPHLHYLDELSSITKDATKRLEAAFEEDDRLTEPATAHHLSKIIPADHLLVLGSSMPIRDVDMFAASDGAPVMVIANRGASGIDGTVATAVGAAEASGSPVTLLCGDLTLLHDLNSLAAVARSRQPIIIITINNDGGGIFSFLPVAEHENVFEPWFGTPHGLTFGRAARMFGLAYEKPQDVPGFQSAYREATVRSGSTLIEIRTDRQQNVDEHDRLYDLLRS